MKKDSQGYVWCVKVSGDNIDKERWMAPSFVNNKSMMKELGWKIWEPKQPEVAPVVSGVDKIQSDMAASAQPLIEDEFNPENINEPVDEKPKRKRITKVTKRKYTRKLKTELAHGN